MTCREFKHAAAALTLWKVSRLPDDKLLDHAEQCQKCSAWLDQQQVLAVTMQTLQAQTADAQAGPHVERALLRVFRQAPFEATQPEAAHRFTPLAWRLSRFFEVGAYAAAAAAVAVGLFLGVRLLEERPANRAAHALTPAVTAPAQTPLATAAATQQRAVSPEVPRQSVAVTRQPIAVHSILQSADRKGTAAVSASQPDDPGYVALMFCDPLICSSDAQVVRMELPAAGVGNEGDGQTQLADVVVGYDGLVRAVRIVNENSN